MMSATRMAGNAPGITESVKPTVRVIKNAVFPLFVREEYLKGIYNLKLRDTDVIVVSWPKSGTTWMQYIVTQVARGEKYLEKKHLFKEHLFLELPQNIDDFCSDGCYKLAENLDSPRFLKSHLLMRFLPNDILKKSKVIYVSRNPKDSAVSYYHFCLVNKILPTYNWDDIVDQLCKGLLPYGDWFEHVLKWWEKRDEPSVLFIKYEDMKQDLRKVVNQVGAFLNESLTEDEVTKICENSLFENMKQNPSVSPDAFNNIKNWKKEEGKHIQFMRKGIVGDWKNWFTVSQNERFDEIYERKMAGSGLEFSFE